MAKPCQKGRSYSPVRVQLNAAKISSPFLALRNEVNSVNFKGWRQRRSQNWVQIGWCLIPNWYLDTQIHIDLCQCPISRETKWCHLGFYPAIKRTIQCWVGHKSRIRCALMRSSVANATLWPWQVDSFNVNPHSTSYWIEGRWWMKSIWCARMLAGAKR